MKNIISIVAIAAVAISVTACGLQTAEPDGAETLTPGSQGPKGDDGVDGADGTDGKDGKDGKDATGGSAGAGGNAGSAGEAGSAGSAGCAGEAGSAGSGGCNCGGSAGEAGSAGSAGEAGAGGGGGSGPYDVSCGTEYPTVTQPMYSPGDWQLSLSGQYLGDGTTYVELVGELPGYTWQSGIAGTKQSDGRWLVEIPEGINSGYYNVSYKSESLWADYGAKEERVGCMAVEAKSWLWCNTMTVDDQVHLDGCGLRIYVHSDGEITAAGNTGDWGE